MRRTYDSSVIYLEDGTFLGFHLGADYCSEHETGIGGLKRDFAIPTDKEVFGLEKRTIGKKPENLYFMKTRRKNKMHYALTYLLKWKIADGDFPLPKGYSLSEDESVFAKWDEHEFAIVVDNRHKKELEELHAHFDKLDIFIGSAPHGLSKSGGFSICIASRFPEEAAKKLYESDVNYLKLTQESEKTGIHNLLKKAGKTYYSLKPKYFEEDGKKILKFWLNPTSQRKYQSGWYTLEELQQWSKEIGPIIIAQQK
jgi:hypothetical protein